jgi:uncharacterized membrane-anchored protein
MINKMNETVRTKENKTRFLLSSLCLLLGVSILVFTLLYLLFHLNNSDKIIYLCIPGFAIGLSSIIVYIFLSAKKTKNQKKYK